MPLSFDDLEKTRANRLNNLQKQMNSKGGFQKPEADPTEWKLKRDAAGNGSAVIRFLPAPPSENDDDAPYVTIYSYSFQDEVTKKYYIEDSLTTIKQPDPCAERNAALYKSGMTDTPRRKTTYVANILVIKDPEAPENEGKVFKFRYGPQIAGIIKEQTFPEDPEDPQVDVYDFLEGANLRLKIYTKANGYPSWDKSKFEKPSALFDGDRKKLEAVWRSEHDLQALLHPSKFKTYDELKKRLNLVTGADDMTSRNTSSVDDLVTPTKAATKPRNAPAPVEEASSSDDDNSWFADFKDELGIDE